MSKNKDNMFTRAARVVGLVKPKEVEVTVEGDEDLRQAVEDVLSWKEDAKARPKSTRQRGEGPECVHCGSTNTHITKTLRPYPAFTGKPPVRYCQCNKCSKTFKA